MENKFQTSFIPKKSFDETGKVRIKTPHNLLSVIARILIFISLIAALGVFAHSFILDRRIASAKEEVVTKEREFDYEAVENIVRVDNQLKSAVILLKNHTAVSNIFNVLEENTISNLRFNSFDFAYISPTRIVLTMKGQARTFGAVARQAEFFSTSSSTRPYFKDPIFSDLDLDESGNVRFTFLTSIDPALIAYDPEEPGLPIDPEPGPEIEPEASSLPQ